MNYKIIAYYRKKRKLSQEDLARQLNIDQEVLVEWENGLSTPNPYEIRQLERILRIPANKLEKNVQNESIFYDVQTESKPNTTIQFDTASANEVIRPFLRTEEKLLWQGQPNRTKIFSKMDGFLVPFAIIWLLGVFMPLNNMILYMPEMILFQIPFIAIGLWLFPLRFIFAQTMKPYLFYAITDQRFIVVNTYKTTTHLSVDWHNVENASLESDATNIGTINLTSSNISNKSLAIQMNLGSVKHGLSLIHINDSSLVHRLIEDTIEAYKKRATT